jgi:hypothetical protein
VKALFFALFITSAALAQPVVGPEVTTPPLEGLGDFSVAPQRDGFAFAWEQAGRINAGHLDATLHLTANPLQLPLFDSAATALLPAVASNGTSVLVVWHERRPGYLESAYLALLSADAQTLLRGPQAINLTKDAPLAMGVNGKYIVYNGDLRYRYNENLETESGDFIKHELAAALGPNGDVATVNESASGSFSCVGACFGHPCSGPLPDCSVTATVVFALPSKVNTFAFTFTIPANTVLPDPFASRPPAIAPNGDSFAGLVRLRDRTDISLFGDIERFTLPGIVPVDAALAGNGRDVLLVSTGQTLTGMVIHADGTTSAPFPIAATGYNPKVVAINSNEFAVLYRIAVDAQPSLLAGRIISLQPSRGRAVR